ncbi:hypothetical protein KVV02_007325 [Mortierella alpina]|uniref:F-box domain-containing protein n=1 Tax=Mortierella alpina TaxID=64518 RepID=A0A9P7ZY40_MORAP|nr:hypothetical protein KVV02_007325 [Mortierella alpina]
MSSIPSSLDIVFSIPELAESIARYLRPRELFSLSTLCRALHHAFLPSLALSLPFILPSTQDRDLATLVSIAPRVRTLCLILRGTGEDLAQQRRLLDVVYRYGSAVQEVHIEHLGYAISVMEELLLKLSNFQKLSIDVKGVIDATAIFTALIARSKAIAEQESLDGAKAHLSCRYRALQSLSISYLHDVGNNVVDQGTLVRALQACPQLRTLEMNEISLSGNREFISASGLASTELCAMSSMKAMKLTRCTVSELQLGALDQLFPNLNELEISGCSGTWHLAIAGNHQSTASTAATAALAEGITTSKVLFPELRRLVLWLEQVPLGSSLWRLVEGRPHLSVLETDILSGNRDELFRFARYCSDSEMEAAPTSPHTVESMVALNMDVQSSAEPGIPLDAQSNGKVLGVLDSSTTSQPRNRLKRLAVQTYVYPPLTTQEFEHFYGALAFRELEYVFLQPREISMSMFPYAKTLISLHLGGAKEDIPANEFIKLKHILRQLPRLEILKIDRFFDSFEIFEGLGREPFSLSQDTDGGDIGTGQSSPGHVDWRHEGASWFTVFVATNGRVEMKSMPSALMQSETRFPACNRQLEISSITKLSTMEPLDYESPPPSPQHQFMRTPRHRKHAHYFWCLIPGFVILYVTSHVYALQHSQDPLNGQDSPLMPEKVPLTELRYFTHDFAYRGMGHKFSELLMGLHFAKNNGLQYVFNGKSFVHNDRNADLEWFGDLMSQRYPTPPELLKDKLNNKSFDMDLKRWIPVTHYRGTVADAYSRMSDLELRRSVIGFGGRNTYFCTEDESSAPSSNCFKAGFSFLNATRDIRDLLQTPTVDTSQSDLLRPAQVDRFAIHVRLGDIQVSETAETYIKLIEGMRQKLSIGLTPDQVHFVFYRPSWWSFSNWKRLWDLKRALPTAQYHDIESVEETVRFMIASKYLMTSGSSLSYMAAYLCPHCHVISTVPKEYLDKAQLMEDDYTANFYYMDEWDPSFRYLTSSSKE